MPKLTDLTKEMTTAPADNDWSYVVDRSDTSESPQGSSYKIQDQYRLAKTVYLAGRSGGQTIEGGTAASENLVLDSTSNATKGEVQVATGSDLRVNEAVITDEITELTTDAGIGINVSGSRGAFYDYPSPHGTWFTFSATGIPDDGSNLYIPYNSADDWWFGFGMGATDQFNFGTTGTEITMTGQGDFKCESFKFSALTTVSSISTGTSDNDKLVTQGYVDDKAFGTLWTTVGNSGSGAEYNSIEDAIVAGKYDLAIIGNFTETKNVTIGANSVHMKITDTCNLSTFEITMNSTGDLSIESGKITYAYTSPGELITNAGTGTLHMSDLITDGTASTAVASVYVGNVGNRVHVDNCRCFLSNTANSGFVNCYASSIISNTEFVGGGAACSGSINNLAGGIASNLTFNGTIQNLGNIITADNASSIINGIKYNATGRGVISLLTDSNQLDNINGNLEIDTNDTAENQISNCYVSDIDLSDSLSQRNKFSNIHITSVNMTIAGVGNTFANLESDVDITIDGDATFIVNSRLVNGVINGDNNAFLLSSFTTYTDNGSFNSYITDISNDGTLATDTPRFLVTEEAIKTYVDAKTTSVATPATYLAAETITGSEINLPVAGNGGAVTLTSNPQITAGNNGDRKRLIGTHDTNTLTVVDGNGLALDNGQSFTIGLNDSIEFVFYNSLWIETSRVDN